VFLGVQTGAIGKSDWRGSGVIKALKKALGKWVIHILPLFFIEIRQFRACLLRYRKTLGGSMYFGAFAFEWQWWCATQIRAILIEEVFFRRKKRGGALPSLFVANQRKLSSNTI
jgi:hypothetical protein